MDAVRIGELARRTGLTVRALRHYEEVGLLAPRRSAAGYRLYDEEQVARLLHVLLLRELGLPLAEVRRCLADPGASLLATLQRRLQQLRERVAQQHRLLGRLEAMARDLATGEPASGEDLLSILETLAMFEKYYSEEQREQLAARREAIGEQRLAEVEAEWPRLIAAVREAMANGVDPRAPEARELALRWSALVREFTGGDPQLAASARRLHEGEPALRERTGIDPAMFAFVASALEPS